MMTLFFLVPHLRDTKANVRKRNRCAARRQQKALLLSPEPVLVNINDVRHSSAQLRVTERTSSLCQPFSYGIPTAVTTTATTIEAGRAERRWQQGSSSFRRPRPAGFPSAEGRRPLRRRR
ncbi:unnamed protein product [Heligmosomoides polygyrus]|uniref:Secreted protein n=1 Tax=Heligmosomoides polygyrus TaxID=6339 RepID=A0A183GE63_HELPZ|nr:unnamed protein product [Heligmosomoides polygyrus]